MLKSLKATVDGHNIAYAAGVNLFEDDFMLCGDIVVESKSREGTRVTLYSSLQRLSGWFN